MSEERKGGALGGDHLALLVPQYMAPALELVIQELHKAMTKHPNPMRSTHEGWAVIREELDEMWDEVRADRPDLALKEAKQVAAMGLRYLIDMAHGKKVA